MRDLLFELRPPILEEAGLAAGIRHYLIDRQPDFSFDVHDHLEDEPADEIRIVLYRIAQEALANAGKHAQASRMSVQVGADASQLRIEITDDGVGFDPRRAREYLRMGRVGLASMRERVELASGTFVVHATPGKGTTIVATLPIDAAPTREFVQAEA